MRGGDFSCPLLRPRSRAGPTTPTPVTAAETALLDIVMRRALDELTAILVELDTDSNPSSLSKH